jgi:hypothetical protein
MIWFADCMVYRININEISDILGDAGQQRLCLLAIYYRYRRRTASITSVREIHQDCVAKCDEDCWAVAISYDPARGL